MPQSPTAKDEMRANAPKRSQQSKTNWSNGTKTRHMDSPLGIEMRRGVIDAARTSTVNPVGLGACRYTAPETVWRGGKMRVTAHIYAAGSFHAKCRACRYAWKVRWLSAPRLIRRAAHLHIKRKLLT